MKKSFLYVVPAALILALLFAGCPQDSDDDDDNGGKPVTSPGSDLSYIAYAFGDGIDTVKAVNHIDLGSNELVIPRGKTLDLATEDVYIREITGESKIIAQGTILFAKAQNNPGKIEFFRAPTTAKIIADRDFITRNVWIDYYDNDGNPRYEESDWENAGIPAEDRPNGDENTAVIHARWQQIVLIDTFDNFRNYSGASEEEKGYIFVEPLSSGEGYAGKYLAIEAPSEGIEEPEAVVINGKAGGLRLYLIGEPVIFANPLTPVNLSSPPNTGGIYKEWAPSRASGGGSSVMNIFGTPLFAYGGTGDGSLTVAGNADVHVGQIIAPGGFTVWGVLKNKVSGTDTSAPTITGTDTPVTAWTTRLNGAEFNGKVSLLGSITNTFGSNVKFNTDVEIAGPSTFSGATFSGDAIFSGPVKFTEPEGSSADVSFAKNVIFAGNAHLHKNITFAAGKTVTYYKDISGNVDYSTILTHFTSGNPSASVEIPLATVTPPAGDAFKDNIVFSAENVTVNGTVQFDKNVTFEGNVTFGGEVKFGTEAEALTADTKSTTIIKGLATFTNNADFGGTVTAAGVEGNPYGNTVIIEEADFRAGTFSSIGNLVLGNSASPKVTFGRATNTNNYANAGTITVPANGGIVFKDDTLTFTGVGGTIDGKIEFNNVKVSVDTGANITLGSSTSVGPVNFELVRASGAESGGFEITGKVKLDDGKIVSLDSTPAELNAEGGIVLQIPPVYGDPRYAGLVLDNSVINLTAGGTIAFAGSASQIIMKNRGNLITNSAETSGYALQSPANTDTGVIIASSSGGGTVAALVTGSYSTTWHVGTLGGTQWVTNPPAEYSNDVYANLLYNGRGFVTTVITSKTALAGSADAYNGADIPEGSIAVFKAQY
jgi:hypothetical protein